MSKTCSLTIILVFAISLLSCKSTSTVKEPGSDNAQSNKQFTYPGPENPNQEAYPKSINISDPGPNKGGIKGVLRTKVGNEPYLTTLFLGSVIYADNPQAPPLVEYSVETSPTALMSNSGEFYFRDIEPGEYGIVIWSPVSSVLIMKPDMDEFFKVQVNEGVITDLGVIFIE